MDQDILSELAPSGTLRAGINLSNFLLVTGRASSGDPIGVAPDMARAIADRLGVAVSYVTFAFARRAHRCGGTGSLGHRPYRR